MSDASGGPGSPDVAETALAEAVVSSRAERRQQGAADTRASILAAARERLLAVGYANLSTRAVAEAAEVPLSQIHYHFGSKQGLVLALFEYLNAQLLDRQDALFRDPTLKLSQQWDRACDYLDEDIASGYVRVLQELIAASWVDKAIAKTVTAGLMGWGDLLIELARKAERQLGSLGPFNAEEIGSLIACAFMGAESLYLLGIEKRGIPLRAALRRFGDLIRRLEAHPVRA